MNLTMGQLFKKFEQFDWSLDVTLPETLNISTLMWPTYLRADACAPFGFGFRRIFPPKCFAFLRRISAKMGGEIIPGLLASIRKATTERREYGKPPKSRG